MKPLPTHVGTPELATVATDNPHGVGWLPIAWGDQGPEADAIDRYFVRYRSREGYLADYFYFGGQWTLGAN